MSGHEAMGCDGTNILRSERESEGDRFPLHFEPIEIPKSTSMSKRNEFERRREKQSYLGVLKSFTAEPFVKV